MLVQRYLDNVVAADRNMIGKVFHVLKWTPGELDRTIEALLKEGAIREVQVRGVKQPQLVPTAFLDCTLYGLARSRWVRLAFRRRQR